MGFDSENQPNLGRTRIGAKASQQSKSIIYLDRNNTPDVWGDIRDTIVNNHNDQARDYCTVVLLPKQEQWDKTLYKQKNPICPHLIFECCKRIFNRKEHGCLNGTNKPKVIDVILKFAKLHDGFDFDDMEQIHTYFDHVVRLDFLKYGERQEPLLDETLNGMIKAYNETPENFGSPSDSTVNEMIRLVDQQNSIDEARESNLLLSVKQTTHGSTQKWHSPSPQKTSAQHQNA